VEDYRDVLGSCLEETVRLSNLISDLLFLARAESPLAHLHWARVDVRELLSSARDYYEAAAAEGGISLTTANGHEPVIAEMNRTLVQRAVGNLVANAVAHTPSGGSVVLRADSEGDSIRIAVADTGVGIPPEALSRVFDRFFRVDQSRSQVSPVTGERVFFTLQTQSPHRPEPAPPPACTLLPRVRPATTQRTHRLLIFLKSVEIGERRQSNSEMEGERRNCFVAITRTRNVWY
jgi:light-regulated signal transduction histidine kinase (bacteriophytochrome)